MLGYVKKILAKVPFIGALFHEQPKRKLIRETMLLGSMAAINKLIHTIDPEFMMGSHKNMQEMDMNSHIDYGIVYGKMLLMMFLVAYTRNIVYSIGEQIVDQTQEDLVSDWRDNPMSKALVKTIPIVGNLADKALTTRHTKTEIIFTMADETAMLTIGTLTMALPLMPQQDVAHFFLRYVRMMGGMGLGSVSVETLKQFLTSCQPTLFTEHDSTQRQRLLTQASSV